MNVHEGVFVPNQNYYSKLKVLLLDVEKITTRTGYDVFFLYIKLETVSTLNRWIYLTERRSSYLVSRVPFCAYSGGRVGGDPEKGVQRAKKVVSDSAGLVDFAIGLVMFFEQFE